MKSQKEINRRKFMELASGTAASLTIVPRHVLGGPGFVAPSDQITVANVGCGTQGLRELPELLQNPYVRVVAVCDPNKYSTDYLDWSPYGIRDGIRKLLGNPKWGQYIKGIPGGRDIARDIINQYYAKEQASNSYTECHSYIDFRDLLEKEPDVDVIKIMTPDHLHATIAIKSMLKGKHVITHKPIANRMYEGRLTIDTARKTKVKSHLLAWSPARDNELTLKWIKDGVIGTLKEIHNWSYRPVWPQWTALPTEKIPIPTDFNWDLWLGPVPHRPYHPNYTHNVFRGWYDFGGGSVADMGHYSLFPLFLTFGINKAPISAKAFGTTTRTVSDNVCKWVNNDVAYPHSCMIKWQFPQQDELPPFDFYWYDGGMKPFAPDELESDNKEIPNEGMLFVGDRGKILANFWGQKPEIIPSSKMEAYSGDKTHAEGDKTTRTEHWINAIREDKEPPGSFQYASTVTETINLASIALRAGKKVLYDAQKMKITNDDQANQFLTREYRPGWEL